MRPINELLDTLTNNDKIIEKINAEIKQNQEDINKYEEDISGYKEGKLPINLDLLKNLIGQFLEGYSAYTVLMKGNQAERIDKQARENVNLWWNNKEKNGWKNDGVVNFANNNNNFLNNEK